MFMGRYIATAILAAVFLTSTPALACGAKVERQALTVELTCSPFQKPKHRLSYRDGALMTIDGRRYSGTDGTVPKFGVRSLRFDVNGAKFVVPRELLHTLFEPHVPPQHGNTLSVQRTKDLVLAQFSGGDGAGAYTAMWVLNTASGHLTRLMYEHPNPDKAKIVRTQLKPNPGVHTDAQSSAARR